MRYLTLGVLVLVFGAGVAAQTPDSGVMTPIQKFIDTFNKGDMAGAAAVHVSGPELVIIDEVPPFVWQGTQAFQAWSSALDADMKKNELTDAKVTIKAPTRVETSGDQAYVIVPAVFTFKQKGVPMREAAQIAVVLKKGSSGWLMQSWAWAGQKPVRAAAVR